MSSVVVEILNAVLWLMNRNLPILRLSFLKVRKAKIKTKELFVVHSLSRVQLFVIPWTTACKAPVSSTFSQSWLTVMSTELVILSNHLILCCPLWLPLSVFPSIKIFSNELALHIMWPKYWSFSFSISPSNEYSGLISFRVYWFDLLAVQGTLKSLLQHHGWKGIKSSVLSLLCGPILIPMQTVGKSMALTRWTFVSKAMSLLSNTLPRFVIAFLPRSKYLLISWLESLQSLQSLQSAVILELRKIKSDSASTFSPSVS